eukprot:623400-Pyramimonas_sp.AAC.1
MWFRSRGARRPSAGSNGARRAHHPKLTIDSPRVLEDPHLEGRVQPFTLLTYQQRAAEFYEWCSAEG